MDWVEAQSGWPAQMGEETVASYAAAFQEHGMTGSTLDEVCCGREVRGTKLQLFGVADLTHCAIIAKGWRKRQRERSRRAQREEAEEEEEEEKQQQQQEQQQEQQLEEQRGAEGGGGSGDWAAQPFDVHGLRIPQFLARFWGGGASNNPLMLNQDSDISDYDDEEEGGGNARPMAPLRRQM